MIRLRVGIILFDAIRVYSDTTQDVFKINQVSIAKGGNSASHAHLPSGT